VHLLGHSYGGVVALEAARRTGDLATLTLYEPAYGLTGTIPEGFVTAVEALVAAGERDEATALMMRELVGLPDGALAELRSDPTAWKPMADSVHTLPRELRTVGTFAFEPARYSTVTVPTVLLAGAVSPPDLHIGVGLVRDAVGGRVVTMAGVDHEAVTTGPDVLVDAILGAVPGPSGIDERPAETAVHPARGGAHRS
jgi:pimeloyl-ACP methyl ester carboxylesterase